MKNNYTNIIWDWNGTLINDISICLESMNHLLAERNLPPMNEKIYKEAFTFPVRDYYQKIGFDFSVEKFEIPALQFIGYYKQYLPSVGLFPEVKTVLHHFKEAHTRQFILSAMEHESLRASVKALRIESYFNDIVGIQDHFARSKTEQGQQLIQAHNLDINKTLLVGDTLHDVEVAETLGIKCVLISQGHQSKKRLAVNGNVVLDDLIELKFYL